MGVCIWICFEFSKKRARQKINEMGLQPSSEQQQNLSRLPESENVPLQHLTSAQERLMTAARIPLPTRTIPPQDDWPFPSWNSQQYRNDISREQPQASDITDNIPLEHLTSSQKKPLTAARIQLPPSAQIPRPEPQITTQETQPQSSSVEREESHGTHDGPLQRLTSAQERLLTAAGIPLPPLPFPAQPSQPPPRSTSLEQARDSTEESLTEANNGNLGAGFQVEEMGSLPTYIDVRRDHPPVYYPQS